MLDAQILHVCSAPLSKNVPLPAKYPTYTIDFVLFSSLLYMILTLDNVMAK